MVINYDNWCELPSEYGKFRMYDLQDENVRLLSYGPIENIKINPNPLVRIHSSCIASEVFHARDCDCADQLHEAMKKITNEGSGLIIHLHQEGRGHGLSKKIRAVSVMQKENCDTVESFHRLNFDLDVRTYEMAVDILKSLNVLKLRLLSNNPRKRTFLEKNGITVETVHTHPKIRKENRAYLFSKNEKMGHTLPLNDEKDQGVVFFYHSDQKWGELANFSRHSIFVDNKIWPTVEHYYQAQKFVGTPYEEEIRVLETPTIAKERAHELLKVHPALDWEMRKEDVMYKGLYAKFTQHPDLKLLLLSTGNLTLAEHTELDLYWADGLDGSGKNRLGRLLMKLREELRNA